MKKIDRRKAIKNLTIGIGSVSLLSSPLTGFANTDAKAKQFLLKTTEIMISRNQ